MCVSFQPGGQAKLKRFRPDPRGRTHLRYLPDANGLPSKSAIRALRIDEKPFIGRPPTDVELDAEQAAAVVPQEPGEPEELLLSF